MRKELVKEGKCDECSHKPKEHNDEEDFWVACNVNDCKCEEYDER